jgi:hypothetical protein
VKPKVYDHLPSKSPYLTHSKQKPSYSLLLEHLEESQDEPLRPDTRNKFKLKKDDRDYFIESFKKMQELKLSKI